MSLWNKPNKKQELWSQMQVMEKVNKANVSEECKLFIGEVKKDIDIMEVSVVAFSLSIQAEAC